ncbi:MAG: UvrB/UvrC motif-containing protein [Candidatus Latescibacteria bacterium]|nr:UvrB/UvrC motif-containing protein [Candidatus Latescibacterota bacterium]
MKCQICNKNEANIVFTQIINNEKIVMQICSECARNKGLTLEIHTESVPPAESLVGSLTVDPNMADLESIPDLKCSICGLSFAEFKKSGLFGCDCCHDAFGEHITKLLKQIHGQNNHEGKTPEEISGEAEIKKEIKKLRLKLERYIKHEEYEKAAEIRDKIKTLEHEESKL